MSIRSCSRSDGLAQYVFFFVGSLKNSLSPVWSTKLAADMYDADGMSVDAELRLRSGVPFLITKLGDMLVNSPRRDVRMQSIAAEVMNKDSACLPEHRVQLFQGL